MLMMSSIFWRVSGGLCAGIWVYLAAFRGAFWRLHERLGAGPVPDGGCSVTAVIPARDEESSIGFTVASLRRQRFDGALRIVVADDESADGTGEHARAAGADAVIRVAPRPAGWKGKLWAVSEGLRIEGRRPNYFLLTDADIEYVSPDILRNLLARAEEGYDLTSIMVRLRCESRAEKMLVPAFVFFFFMLYPPAWVISKAGPAAAAGGCMLIRREILERIGGIASIRTALIDDCALARQIRGAGGRVWLGISNLDVRSIREYARASDIRAMISRSAFAQLNHSATLLAGTVAGMILTYVAPVALLFSGDKGAAALGAAAWTIGAVVFTPVVREYRAPLWTALCLPGIALFYLAATLESAIHYWSGRGGTWKGRVQDV